MFKKCCFSGSDKQVSSKLPRDTDSIWMIFSVCFLLNIPLPKDEYS